MVAAPRRALALLVLTVVACAPATAAAPSPSATPSEAAATASLAAPSASAVPPDAPAATAAPAPSPAPPPLPRCPGAPDGAMVALCPSGARVAVDAVIGERDMAVILGTVAADLEAVQREFGWTLRATPWIDVYATNARYADGLSRIFGYSRATADYLAENSVAFFEPSLHRIAVSWDDIRDRRPVAAIRHEITHLVTLEACAPRCDLVPAWLNEGEARLAEALVPGAGWRLLRVRYEAASMVATDTLMPLASLVTQGQWNAIGDWAGYYKYQEAARAVELLRDDIGDGAIARLYQRIRRGDDVARAYASLAGRSFDAFVRELPGRILAAAPEPRGLVTVTPGPDGGGASYLLYGFPPSTTATVRVRSRHVDETRDVTVSPQGAVFGSIDRSYPSGLYAIAATSGATVATASIAMRGDRVQRTPPVD